MKLVEATGDHPQDGCPDQELAWRLLLLLPAQIVMRWTLISALLGERDDWVTDPLQ